MYLRSQQKPDTIYYKNLHGYESSGNMVKPLVLITLVYFLLALICIYFNCSINPHLYMHTQVAVECAHA